MCPRYEIKQSDVEVPVMLELWEMWCTPSLSLHPGPLWSGEVASDRVLCMGQKTVWHLNWVKSNDSCWIELFEIELFDQLTMCKQLTDF